jgi:predicted ArsR family transcriptional regulator
MKPRSPDYQKERRERQERRIIEALSEPMDILELAAALCMARSTAQRHLTRMVNAKRRKVRIAGWRPTDGRPLALYKRGSAPNAPSLAKTTAEIWEQIKADPVRHEAVKASNRRTNRRRKGLPPIPVTPASAFAALFAIAGKGQGAAHG